MLGILELRILDLGILEFLGKKYPLTPKKTKQRADAKQPTDVKQKTIAASRYKIIKIFLNI